MLDCICYFKNSCKDIKNTLYDLQKVYLCRRILFFMDMSIPLEQYPTLFLDRDGVINEQIVGGYVMDFKDFRFKEGVFEALRTLRGHFSRILLVTNQQCVGKGLCTMADIDRVHEQMQEELRRQDCAIDRIYCCPHLASDQCACRKPLPGMAERAFLDFPDIDRSQSVMAGDTLSDILFAQNAGLIPVHVGVKRDLEFDEIQKITPYHFDTLLDFANQIQTSGL